LDPEFCENTLVVNYEVAGLDPEFCEKNFPVEMEVLCKSTPDGFPKPESGAGRHCNVKALLDQVKGHQRPGVNVIIMIFTSFPLKSGIFSKNNVKIDVLS
jgi:hypothetical protein